MSENLMCSAHKSTSEEYRKRYDNIFKQTKNIFNILCPHCKIFYNVNDLKYNPIDKVYHCPKCATIIYKKEFGGGVG